VQVNFHSLICTSFRTLSCKCSDKHCDFNGAGFFLELPLQEIIVAESENND